MSGSRTLFRVIPLSRGNPDESEEYDLLDRLAGSGFEAGGGFYTEILRFAVCSDGVWSEIAGLFEILNQGDQIDVVVRSKLYSSRGI